MAAAGTRLFRSAVRHEGGSLKCWRIAGSNRLVWEKTTASGAVGAGATKDEALYKARVAEQLAESRAAMSAEEWATVAAYEALLYG